MRKMKAAIEDDSMTSHESEGVDECIAELLELLSAVWLTKGELNESAEPAWLAKYLSDSKENGKYDAWSWADKVRSSGR